jgi:hypothetical protein
MKRKEPGQQRTSLRKLHCRVCKKAGIAYKHLGCGDFEENLEQNGRSLL